MFVLGGVFFLHRQENIEEHCGVDTRAAEYTKDLLLLQYQREQYTYCRELLKLHEVILNVPSIHALCNNRFG